MNKKYLLAIGVVLLVITIGISFSYFVSKTTENNLENANTQVPTAKIPEFTLVTDVKTNKSIDIYPGTKNYISASVKGKKTGGEETDTNTYEITYEITGSVTITGEAFTEGDIIYHLYKTTEDLETGDNYVIDCKEVSGTTPSEGNQAEVHYSQECTINEGKLGTALNIIDKSTKELATGTIQSGTVEFTYSDKVPADDTTTHYYYLVVEYEDTGKDQSLDMGKGVTYAINSIVSTETGIYESFATKFLANNTCSEPAETITEEQAKNCLVKEKGYRFEGPDPNNYVRFNNEEWRIIGIFDVETENSPEQLIKIIRTESEKKAWDETNSNDWENPATLNTYLNSEYLNAISEKDKIANVKWNIGASYYKQTADAVYKEEIITQTTNNYKIGLMSASDYGYAALNSTCSRAKILHNYDNSGCSEKDWLFALGKYMWTLTPISTNSNNVLRVDGDGPVVNNCAVYKEFFRPSVYLNSDVSLSVGTSSGEPGSQTNPYIVS